MKLIYLSEEAIDDIKINFKEYKKHFDDETNEWFIEKFKKNNWMHESKIECKEFELNCDEDYNVSDRENVKILYDALQDLSPALASDERLWAGMSFCRFWSYVKYRRKKEIEEKKGERDILNSFLFMRGRKRSCFMQCLSRLWWTGYLLYDGSTANHYRAVDLIAESAYSSNIILVSSNNFVSNKNGSLN